MVLSFSSTSNKLQRRYSSPVYICGLWEENKWASVGHSSLCSLLSQLQQFISSVAFCWIKILLILTSPISSVHLSHKVTLTPDRWPFSHSFGLNAVRLPKAMSRFNMQKKPKYDQCVEVISYCPPHKETKRKPGLVVIFTGGKTSI